VVVLVDNISAVEPLSRLLTLQLVVFFLALAELMLSLVSDLELRLETRLEVLVASLVVSTSVSLVAVPTTACPTCPIFQVSARPTTVPSEDRVSLTWRLAMPTAVKLLPPQSKKIKTK
jgi:hypothetical protein